MTNDEIRPFLGKCIAVSLQNGENFQGLLREKDAAFEVDAGSSQTSIDSAAAVSAIELLEM